MIGGVIKYFRFSYDYAVWELSYTNLNMLLATIPEYEPADEKKDEKEKGEVKVDSLEDLDKLFND